MSFPLIGLKEVTLLSFPARHCCYHIQCFPYCKSGQLTWQITGTTWYLRWFWISGILANTIQQHECSELVLCMDQGKVLLCFTPHKHYVGRLCGVIPKDCCVFSSCSSRFSSTSVLIRLWLSCPPHWVDVLKISWDLPSCSSLCSLPTLSSDICSLEQRLTPSAPSSSACKRFPKQQHQIFKKDD